VKEKAKIMRNEDAVSILHQRGFIYQESNPEGLKKIMQAGTLTCYSGFDPTADSLHVGHLIPIMALAHLQRAGNRVIAVVGGGTALIGDPSGRTEMRELLDEERMAKNLIGIQKSLAKYIDFDQKKALMINNMDWLKPLNYIEFLRLIGPHFSVNRMVTQDSVRLRMEREGEGLSFLEFNYPILQAYDFYVLAQRHECVLQLGGSDQWGNIMAGVDLGRRLAQKELFGITYHLLTTSSGQKMGKTAKGAVWLNEERMSPYDYFQFWRNTEDPDVLRFLKLFTFLSLEEIEALGKLEGKAINEAKEILAFEATKLAHGEEAARKAATAAGQLWGKSQGGEDDGVPRFSLPRQKLESGIPAFRLFQEVGLCKSASEARRLIEQKGAYLRNKIIEDPAQILTLADLEEEVLLLRAGKKKYLKVTLL
jgi:tyrosyl-tRNA synthetase